MGSIHNRKSVELRTSSNQIGRRLDTVVRVPILSHVVAQVCNALIVVFFNTNRMSRHPNSNAVGRISGDTSHRHLSRLLRTKSFSVSNNRPTVSNMISLSQAANSERPIRTETEELATYPAAEPWLGAMEVMAPGNIGWPARYRTYREVGGL